MAARFDLVTFDSPSPDRLARFWMAALDLVEIEREDGDRWIVLGDVGGRRIGVQRGDVITGSIHLDLVCSGDEFAAETDRLVDLGASLSDGPRSELYGSIVNLADPDGNPFDLCAYT